MVRRKQVQAPFLEESKDYLFPFQTIKEVESRLLKLSTLEACPFGLSATVASELKSLVSDSLPGYILK